MHRPEGPAPSATCPRSSPSGGAARCSTRCWPGRPEIRSSSTGSTGSARRDRRPPTSDAARPGARRLRRGADPLRAARRLRAWRPRRSGCSPAWASRRTTPPAADRAVGRLADAGRAGPPAAGPARRAPPRRAHQPPRHRQRGVARAHAVLVSRAPSCSSATTATSSTPWPSGSSSWPPGRRPSTSAGSPSSSCSGRSGWPSCGRRGCQPGPGGRPRRAVHRAVPLQGHQGPPGAEPDQDAREAGADRGAGPPDARWPASASRRRAGRPGWWPSSTDVTVGYDGDGRADRASTSPRAGREAGAGRPERRGQDHAAAPAPRASWRRWPGRCTIGANVDVAYFAQHQVESLDLERTVLEEIQAAAGRAAGTATCAPCWARSASRARPPTAGSAACPAASDPAGAGQDHGQPGQPAGARRAHQPPGPARAATCWRTRSSPTPARSCWSPTTAT